MIRRTSSVTRCTSRSRRRATEPVSLDIQDWKHGRTANYDDKLRLQNWSGKISIGIFRPMLWTNHSYNKLSTNTGPRSAARFENHQWRIFLVFLWFNSI